MAMNLGGGGDEDEVVSSINTTPLVDVMLVLLIIFLITIPVVTQTVAVNLPKETNITSTSGVVLIDETTSSSSPLDPKFIPMAGLSQPLFSGSPS